MDRELFFQSFGLTSYESKILLSLEKLKKANAKEISRDSGVPQNKIYKIMRDFEKSHLLEQIPGEQKSYRLLNLKTFISSKLKEKEKDLNELKKIHKKFGKINNENFIFSLIVGQKAIMDRLAENNAFVGKEIFGVQRNWKVWGEGLRQMSKAIKKGVDVRFIGLINEETKKRALEWKKLGCNVKAYNSIFGQYPLRFTVFDNKEARITIGKPEITDPKKYVTVWTTSKPLIKILRSQFLEMWKNSVPIEEA